MKLTPSLFVVVWLSGCVKTSQVDNEIRNAGVPQNWQVSEKTMPATDNWFAQFSQPKLSRLVNEALDNNQSLRQKAYDVKILEQKLVQADANFWPDLDLGLNTGRSKSISGSVSNSSSIELEASYELDIWGKLSAAQQQANLDYFAAKAQYQQDKQTLVANVVSSWFDWIAAKQLTNLFEQRVNNAKQNLDIIESGYQQGLNAALDVYLSRNELNSELSNYAEQQDKHLQSVRNIERLLGRYPDASLTSTQLTLPLLTTDIPLGMPLDIISRKPELLASWYQVLAKDAGVAFAHKQRFPSINLRASISNNADELTNLLSGSSLAWSLLGGLTAPLFRAGDLKANEEIARLQLKQQEQIYLDTLYNAFSNVENAITAESSLKKRYQSTLAAQQNAEAAETLAFEQYQRGLVTYTTVLEAQGRSFNAQSALIQIKNQLLANRINLHLALGGDFSNDKNIQDNKQEDVLPNE
ncbi:efflux transporter outer membrane subunit [uncultured Paraglaciecola sp.]|uniref:efflux transporter outer membrane subunit n=1 Tax=uncultured Paraglaciecola sp. TaxID=1765024 RepID=UPI0025FD543C|nr:efflux transporter outer membrane subunit [uncultured Paraglaciecola sp.]